MTRETSHGAGADAGRDRDLALGAVQAAADARTEADRDYRRAILEAAATGARDADIARAAGITRQAVRQLRARAAGRLGGDV